jgi:hypothetical protein
LRPLAGSDDAPFALVGNVGAGRVVAFADSSPLQNAYLGRDDDAAVLLGAVGPAPRPVVFDEHSHGYGGAGGSIPAPWWRASWVALAAVVMLMWSVARRLGPAEEVARALPPPRREYVDALAVSLARSREPAVAMAGLQRRARARLSARLGLTEQAGRDELKAAAARAGLSLADDIDVLFDAPGRDAEVLAIARVAARQEGVR